MRDREWKNHKVGNIFMDTISIAQTHTHAFYAHMLL